jgi:hypothetical protein
MNITPSPCEAQQCTKHTTNPGCYKCCAEWQNWFRKSWRELQKRLGAKPKDKEGKA